IRQTKSQAFDFLGDGNRISNVVIDTTLQPTGSITRAAVSMACSRCKIENTTVRASAGTGLALATGAGGAIAGAAGVTVNGVVVTGSVGVGVGISSVNHTIGALTISRSQGV